MKKYLLVFIALFLTAAVVTAAVLNSGKKTKKVSNSKCCLKKVHCPRQATSACY